MTNPYLPPEPPARRVHPALIGALAALVLAVAGLGAWLVVARASSDDAQVPAAASGSLPAASPKTPSAPAVAAAGTKTRGLKLGARVKVPASADLPSATVQVIAYKRDSSLGAEAAMDAVQLRVCLGKERRAETIVTATPWSLLYAGGESKHNEISTGGPAPAWPTFEERTLRPGECVKGWLAFTDIAGEPEGVSYVLDSGFTASWSLS